jgi:8-amino-7-oxononanoate synthase
MGDAKPLLSSAELDVGQTAGSEINCGQASLRVAKIARHQSLEFSSLPGNKALQKQRQICPILDIEDPRFRVHDVKCGPIAGVSGRPCLNFTSYDYLGLNGHPAVAAAAKDAIDRYGTSSSGSRLAGGERPIHRELECALADFYETDDCLVMVSGHATNVALISTLVGPNDLLVYDRLAHNSILVGAKLSGARCKSFPHNNLKSLSDILERERATANRALIVVEGLYSMEGDIVDLPALIEIKQRHNAWLMIDEAHALGVLGRSGKGTAQHFDIETGLVDIWMGTLSKALASCGGYVAGSRALIEHLRYAASGFVYSVGLSPALAGSAAAALSLLKADDGRVQRLQANGRRFLDHGRRAGLNMGASSGFAVAPIIIGNTPKSLVLAHGLFQRGISVAPIIYPAVSKSAARLRFFITSEHSSDQIDFAVSATRDELASLETTAFDKVAKEILQKTEIFELR